jgi:DNA-binding beta-propeller fold protein YncE
VSAPSRAGGPALDRRRALAALAAALAAPRLLAPGAAAAADRSVWLPSGFAYPNGVAVAPDGTIFVGSVSSGRILAIGPDGAARVAAEETADRFSGTALRLDAARGLLWVASPDFLGGGARGHRLAVVEAATGVTAWSAAPPDSGFVNDIALDGAGGAVVTDSLGRRLFHVAAPGAPFRTVAAGLGDPSRRLGPAGVAVDGDGSLVVGLFDDGRLLRIDPRDGSAREIAVADALERPDGLAFAPDGRLLLVDAGLATGNGRLLAVDLAAPPPHPVATLAEGMDAPVNLALRPGAAVVSESGLGHRLRPGAEGPAPERFRLVVVPLTG